MTDDTQPQRQKRLTRSSADSMIGGVAYLGLLAFVPSDDPERSGGTSRVAAIVGAVVLGLALVTFLDTPFFVFGPGVLVLGLLALGGVLLWRAVGGDLSGSPGRIAARVALAT